VYALICTHREYYFNGFTSAYALKGHSVIPIMLIFSRRSSKIIVEERAHRIFLFKYIQHILQKLLNWELETYKVF